MKKALKYFTKAHRILALLISIYGAYGTFLIIHESGTPLPFKFISVIIFSLLVVFSIIFMAKYLSKWSEAGIDGTFRLSLEKEDATPVTDKRKEIVKIIAGDYKEIFFRQFSTKTTLIRIIVYHGERILSALKDNIVKAIMDNNTEVQLLIAKKDSVLLEEVWKLENKTEYQRLDRVRELIEEIRTEVSNKSYKFKYHEYNTQARYAIVAFDGRWAWWTPYHPGRRVEKTTSFIY